MLQQPLRYRLFFKFYKGDYHEWPEIITHKAQLFCTIRDVTSKATKEIVRQRKVVGERWDGENFIVVPIKNKTKPTEFILKHNFIK